MRTLKRTPISDFVKKANKIIASTFTDNNFSRITFSTSISHNEDNEICLQLSVFNHNLADDKEQLTFYDYVSEWQDEAKNREIFNKFINIIKEAA